MAIFRLVSVSSSLFYLATGMSVPVAVPIAAPAADRERNDPVTFYQTMQSMIGDGLKAHYEPPKKLSHELFVLMLQLKEHEERDSKAKTLRARLRRAKASRAAAVSL